MGAVPLRGLTIVADDSIKNLAVNIERQLATEGEYEKWLHELFNTTTIAIEINYKIEANAFDCHLLLLFPDNIYKQLAKQLDVLLH